MTAVLPGGNNAYVASHESTQGLVVDFIRNPKSFPVLQYAKYMPVNKMTGYYMSMKLADRMRITDTKNASSMWQDGADRPQGNAFGEKFEWLQYTCLRYIESDVIGDLMGEQASWDVYDHSARGLAQLAMTKLTQRMVTLLTTGGTWDSAHTSAVSSITGVTSKWDVSTTARKDIKRSLDHATEVIVKATGAAIKDEDLILVIGKGDARLMSISQEIVDYLKGSPEAMGQIRGQEGPTWRNRAHGLPDMLYGHPVVVEDTVKMTSVRGATDSRSYVLGSGNALLLAKPGGLEGQAGGPDFSTATIFGYTGSQDGKNDPSQDMLVEQLHDEKHKRTDISVTLNCDEVVTAGQSGFLFTEAAG